MGRKLATPQTIQRYALRVVEEAATLEHGLPARCDQVKKLAGWVHGRLRSEPVEVFGVIFYDEDGTPIGYTEPFRGDEASSVVSFRYVLSVAVQLDAALLVLYHNHPRGRAYPSQADVEATAALGALCRALRLVLVDHIIINGDGEHCSLREEQLLGPDTSGLWVWLRWWEKRVTQRGVPSPRCRDGRSRVRPKYRDPATGATWAGRGSRPRWLTAYLAAGRALEEFRIGSSPGKVVAGPWPRSKSAALGHPSGATEGHATRGAEDEQ